MDDEVRASVTNSFCTSRRSFLAGVAGGLLNATYRAIELSGPGKGAAKGRATQPAQL
jgi:hypothetical protein